MVCGPIYFFYHGVLRPPPPPPPLAVSPSLQQVLANPSLEQACAIWKAEHWGPLGTQPTGQRRRPRVRPDDQGCPAHFHRVCSVCPSQLLACCTAPATQLSRISKGWECGLGKPLYTGHSRTKCACPQHFCWCVSERHNSMVG